MEELILCNISKRERSSSAIHAGVSSAARAYFEPYAAPSQGLPRGRPSLHTENKRNDSGDNSSARIIRGVSKKLTNFQSLVGASIVVARARISAGTRLPEAPPSPS